LAQTTQTEQPTEPLNTRLPKPLHVSIKKAAIDLGLKLQGFSAFAYRFSLYIIENEDRNRTKELAKACYPLVCLRTARNDLAKQGLDVSWLDSGIKKTEEFLQQK
jgi:hypothetical protein